MRRDQRLTSPKDFAAARHNGRSWSDNLLVLITLPNGLGASRFGFAVGKSVGGAVIRNKVKRRLRETARLTGVEQGWDLVLIARKDAGTADFPRLRRSMTGLLRRAGVLGTSAQPSGPVPKAE